MLHGGYESVKQSNKNREKIQSSLVLLQYVTDHCSHASGISLGCIWTSVYCELPSENTVFNLQFLQSSAWQPNDDCQAENLDLFLFSSYYTLQCITENNRTTVFPYRDFLSCLTILNFPSFVIRPENAKAATALTASAKQVLKIALSFSTASTELKLGQNTQRKRVPWRQRQVIVITFPKTQ